MTSWYSASGQAGGGDKAALPADLALVPPDAITFSHVRVADLWKSPAGVQLQQHLKQLAKGQANLVEDVEKALGTNLSQIERLTVIFANPGPTPICVVATTQPYERAKVLASAVPGAKETKHKERTYYSVSDRAVSFVNDRLYVIGLVNEVQSLLDQPAQKAAGPLSGALRLAARKHSITSALNVSFASKQIPENQLPPQAEPLKPLLQAEFACLMMDFGEETEALLRVAFTSDDGAKEGGKAIKAGVALAREALTKDLKELAKQSDIGKNFIPLMEQAETGLQGAEIEQKGPAVELFMRLKGDWAAPSVALLQAVQQVRGAANRVQSTNNLKQIALAMHNYHDTYGRFPAHAIYGKDGKPLLSWRVSLLPFLDQDGLYKEFHLDEPWDSEHNKKLLEKMPPVFVLRGMEEKNPHKTVYQGFVGTGAFFEGTQGIRITDITDGTSNTIMIVEAAKPVPWTKPEDLTYEADKPLPKLGGHFPNGFNAAYCDGSVRMLSNNLQEKTLRALITRNGGEVIESDN
jgi:prepilin-type processing-associated H-X9-DG protein